MLCRGFVQFSLNPLEQIAFVIMSQAGIHSADRNRATIVGARSGILLEVTSAPRIQGFRGEFLWELEIAERQLTAVAEAIPAEKYDWRPHEKARSVSEILVHVAVGNFMLLDQIGVPAPADVYGALPTETPARMWAMVKRHDELEKTLRNKDAVQSLLKRSLFTASESITRSAAEDLDRRQAFFGEQTSFRRVYLRLLAHTHEHMGQLIAYLRFNGIAPPWPDWRPDRREP